MLGSVAAFFTNTALMAINPKIRIAATLNIIFIMIIMINSRDTQNDLSVHKPFLIETHIMY